MIKLIQYAVLLAVMLWIPAGHSTTLAKQRQQYFAAKDAYDAGNLASYQRLTAGLKNYPLYPYLRYMYLRDHADSVAESELQQFIDRYDDSPPGVRLRNHWLFDLAGAKRWSEYLQLFQESEDPALQCYQVLARLNTATATPTAELLDEAEALWRVGHFQPPACDGVFDYLNNSHRMNSELIWARVRLAMEEGELQLADHLAYRLSAPEQRWIQRWGLVYHHPATQLNSLATNEDLPIVREILAFGARRLARSDAEAAHIRWQQLKSRFHFSVAQRAEVERFIAISAARQRSPQALQWLSEVKESDTDAATREWRIRSAVLAGDWALLERWTQTLPKDEQTESTQYWRARALEQQDGKTGAELLYKTLAKEHSYYGFMANDRLHQDYALISLPTPDDAVQFDKMAARPSMQRASEFYQLGLIPEARREWTSATKKMNPDELAQAALLAKRWGWYERAIITAAKGGHWDDLELRFPTPYRSQVVDTARRQQLDASWVYGVMRQESAFMVDAKSSAGALGLMQLMPATANDTARLLDWPPRSTQEVLAPTNNIQLGSAYLRHILDRFRGNQMLATAAYNAGPGRVRQWLPSTVVPADQWVEAIPFSETRKYVQNVLSYSVIFDWRLKQPLQPLQRRMGKGVPTRNELTKAAP